MASRRFPPSSKRSQRHWAFSRRLAFRPYMGSSMTTAKDKQIQILEKKHRKLFKEQPEFLRPDSESLEQPYAGEVVETITTYSVYGEPT